MESNRVANAYRVQLMIDRKQRIIDTNKSLGHSADGKRKLLATN
jgi:hypothetical protein